jgi:hypothetical protein
LVEHLLCKQGVGGSSPLVSTTKPRGRWILDLSPWARREWTTLGRAWLRSGILESSLRVSYSASVNARVSTRRILAVHGGAVRAWPRNASHDEDQRESCNPPRKRILVTFLQSFIWRPFLRPIPSSAARLVWNRGREVEIADATVAFVPVLESRGIGTGRGCPHDALAGRLQRRNYRASLVRREELTPIVSEP